MSAVKKGNQKVADQIWHALVDQVMESRDGWRRNVTAATGLSFSRVRILKRVEVSPRTLSQLAEMTGTDAPATSLAVSDLEERGMVERRPHPSDRRAKLVTLTKAGKAALAIARKVPDPAPPSLAGMPDKELAVLSRILQKPPTS
jgi:DNA-binding MarR family transcriptional regulator